MKDTTDINFTKTCTKCLLTKQITQFNKEHAWCTSCLPALKETQINLTHIPAKLVIKQTKPIKKKQTPEERKAARKKYRQDNKDKIALYQRKWREKNA